jgi:hypothetical protein
MGISQKIRAVIKLLKEIDREYATMTRKNKCIPSKKRRISKRETKKATMSNSNVNSKSKSKSVRFNKPLTEEPEPEPVSEEPVEQVNPFEESEEPNEEPIEEPEMETNPVDDGLTKV